MKIEFNNEDITNKDMEISNECQDSFTLVPRGAKSAKCEESFGYLNVSNSFSVLEIEPCLDSFDGKNVDENDDFYNPVITKAHKKNFATY